MKIMKAVVPEVCLHEDLDHRLGHSVDAERRVDGVHLPGEQQIYVRLYGGQREAAVKTIAAPELLSGDLEIVLHAVVAPRTGHRTFIQAEVFDFPADDVVYRLPRSVFPIGLAMNELAVPLE